MSENDVEIALVQMLNFQFKGYAEAAELILAYCLKYSVADIKKGTATAHATLEKMEAKQWVRVIEANAGKHFYKLTIEGKRQLVM